MRYLGPDNMRDAAIAWSTNPGKMVRRRKPAWVCVEIGAHGKQIFTLRTLRGLICASALVTK